MAWVTWRQHRSALAGAAVLLGGLAGYLWLAGLRSHHAYALAIACHPAGSDACSMLRSDVNGPAAEIIAVLLQAVPALIGAFAGAPVLARELETGTFRFAWTQGFGRRRWALAKLVSLAAVLAAGSWLLSMLFSWYYQPFLADGWQIPLGPLVFDLRGVAYAGWTLAAFTTGALAGLLIRRVVPAIAVTLASYAAMLLTVSLYLRQHYLAPLLARNSVSLPGSSWIIRQWWTTAGRPASDQALAQVLQHESPGLAPKGGVPSSPGVWRYLIQHGFTRWISYQPGSRYWPFQWIETGWLLALSAVLITITVWLVRRRPV